MLLPAFAFYYHSFISFFFLSFFFCCSALLGCSSIFTSCRLAALFSFLSITRILATGKFKQQLVLIARHENVHSTCRALFFYVSAENCQTLVSGYCLKHQTNCQFALHTLPTTTGPIVFTDNLLTLWPPAGRCVANMAAVSFTEYAKISGRVHTVRCGRLID